MCKDEELPPEVTIITVNCGFAPVTVGGVKTQVVATGKLPQESVNGTVEFGPDAGGPARLIVTDKVCPAVIVAGACEFVVSASAARVNWMNVVAPVSACEVAAMVIVAVEEEELGAVYCPVALSVPGPDNCAHVTALLVAPTTVAPNCMISFDTTFCGFGVMVTDTGGVHDPTSSTNTTDELDA